MRRAALALAALALATTGCPRRKPAAPAAPPDLPPRLGAVSVEDFTEQEAVPAGVKLDPQVFTRDLRAKLAGAGLFAGGPADAGDVPVARVRAELAIEEAQAEGKGAARAAIRFRVEIRPSEGVAPHWSEDVQAGAETTYALEAKPDRNALFAKLVTRTLNDLADGYLSRQRLWRGNAGEVHAGLTADAGEVRAEAIRAVADRQLTAEVPELLRLLSDDDESVRDAALGALVQLHERRAVAEIAKQRSMRDRREMRKILDAIAMLGGQEAFEYLNFVADTHEDEEIRDMAKKALVRLKRRADAG
jgi:hypothetical protein